MSPRKKMTVTPTDAEEAPMTTTPATPDVSEELPPEVSLATEMTDAEAIETLVRTDETHLSDDLPPFTSGLIADETPKQVKIKPGVTEGTTKQKTQGTLPEKFHCLSEIDDGVFVAWDRCHNGSSRHAISECTCKGGPTEPPYVTKWREEWIAKRAKEADARRKKADKALAATVSDGIETATEAVQAAATEEVSSDES